MGEEVIGGSDAAQQREQAGPAPRLSATVHGSRQGKELKAKMIAGRDGDAGAYAALFRALSPRLAAFFRRRLRESGDVVDDLVQETLIAVHKQRDAFDRTRSFT